MFTEESGSVIKPPQVADLPHNLLPRLVKNRVDRGRRHDDAVARIAIDPGRPDVQGGGGERVEDLGSGGGGPGGFNQRRHARGMRRRGRSPEERD